MSSADQLSPEKGDIVLRLEDVGRRLDGKEIVRDVNWTVRRGERWVVLGPNGSGKTTVARMASLRLHPSSGTLEVLGTELGRADIRPLLGQVGYASAALADQLRADLQVDDVVMTALNGALEPWWHTYTDDDRGSARRALERAGVARLATQRFGTCSSGEKQRVLIARALMTDPSLLILDEPTAALDLGGRESFVHSLERLASEVDGPAIALITHHVDEIPPSFTHALLMRDGSVHASGPIEDVLDEDQLSEVFGISLRLSRGPDMRWSARARLSSP